MYLNCSLVALLCIGAPAVAADFTGTWNLNAAKSALRTASQAPPVTLKLTQQGDAVECVAVGQGGQQETCSYTLDRKENRDDSGSATRSTVAKWEGESAIVNTIVMQKQGGQYTQMDRWTLGRDGNTLRIRRTIIGLHGETESLLVYEREGVEISASADPQAEFSTRRHLDAAEPDAGAPSRWTVAAGTKLPLALINSVSTKHAAPGDRIYLQTVYPILVDGRVVIPPGSFVNGTVTQAKRAGRVKGRAELYVRFDTLILPNGTARDFRARVGNLDGRASESLDKDEGRIKGEGNKGGDARTVGEAAAGGTSVGVMAGAVAGRPGMGAGVGAMAGAAAGLVGVLASRGPDAQLAAGSVVEMVLDRDLHYTKDELELPSMQQGQMMVPGGGPAPSVRDRQSGVPVPGRRIPY